MNILLLFNQNDWRKSGYPLEKYFLSLGHDVTLAAREFTPYWTNFNHRLPFYIPKGIPVSLSSLEQKFNKKFDLLIEFDGAGQHHLAGMKKVNIPKILWSMDTHLESKRRFQAYFQRDYTCVYTCHKDYAVQFEKARWLPVAADPELHRKLDVPKTCDIVFVGNTNPQAYPERVRLLQMLSQTFSVKVFNRVFRDDMVNAMNQGKIVFNKSLNGDLNFRVFEALSCGAFLLTDRINNGLPDLFVDGKHLVLYSDEKDLHEKTQYYLAHDREREEIAARGQKEVHEKHTLYHRAKKILEENSTKA